MLSYLSISYILHTCNIVHALNNDRDFNNQKFGASHILPKDPKQINSKLNNSKEIFINDDRFSDFEKHEIQTVH